MYFQNYLYKNISGTFNYKHTKFGLIENILYFWRSKSKFNLKS
ncbi:hypothetical protein CCAN2_1140009 [Capnocytophaga canimorsus]|uniref:Uncharacterized protein n=1 Tax=Capnocytophaga canimorsus TaxID=28188 RepID=A0A0B7I9X3_9FLAO|nr:hypothetical protein CCAN2_1140009 [Capnocytophaga canimorsus]CEN46663.1 hypothetical protein CCAN11_1150002 [Capnocytophaga canimorsus]